MKRVLACIMGVVLITGLMPSIPIGESAAWADSLIPATATSSAEQSGSETWVEADCSDRILQAGGLNEKELVLGKAFDALAASTSDEEGAAAAIVAACEAWDGERSMTTVDVSAYGVSMSRIGQVFYHVINEHPQLFYVDHTYQAMGSNGVAEIVYVSFDTTYDASSIATFNAAVDQVLAGAEDGWSDEQKALYLHDYIVTHCEYDLTYQKRSAYTVLVDHSSVCQGYALAFDYLAEKLGMTDTVVTSEALNHAWNLVDVDGETYYIDCTWDDPTNYKSETHCSHKNFLRSKEGFSGTGHGSKKSKDGESTEPVTDWADTWGADVYSSSELGSSSAYESAFWSDVLTPIPHVGNLWAYVHGTWTIKTSDVMVHDYGTNEDRALAEKLPGTWGAWGKPGYIWNTYHYNYLVTDGNAFYMTTPTAIYRINVDGTSSSVYTLNEDELSVGYVYGLSYVADEAGLFYCLSEGYNVASTGQGTYYLGNSLHNATVLADDRSYTGGKLTPDPVVKLGTETLVKGRDYEVSSYANNVEVGTATVTVKGVGDYAGTASGTFKINVAPIANATVQNVVNKTYTGSALEQSPVVKLGTKTLSNGTDYTLSYANNVKAGTATFTVKGKGNYAGTVSGTFKIAAASLANATVTGVQGKTYTGKVLSQAPTVKLGSKTLSANADYTVSYLNVSKHSIAASKVVGAGTYYLKVTGKGDYAGSPAVAKFTVAKAANPMKVAGKTVKASHKKKATLSASKAFSFSKKAQGGVTYARVAKGSSKWLTVSPSGKVTVKARAPRTTHKLNVKVTAKGNANYKALSKIVAVKVRVK